MTSQCVRNKNRLTSQYVRNKNRQTTINKKYYSGNEIRAQRRPLKKAASKTPTRTQWSPPRSVLIAQMNKCKDAHSLWQQGKNESTNEADYPLITVVTPTFSIKENMRHILDNFQRQSYPNKELIVVAPEKGATKAIVSKYEKGKNVCVVRVGKDLIGQDINIAIESSEGIFISLMSEGDYYFPNYLVDMFYHTTDHIADVYAKVTHFTFCEQKLFCPTVSHQNVVDNKSFPTSGSLFIKRMSWKDAAFQEGVALNSVEYIKHIRNKGMTLFTTDMFNYVRFIEKKNKGRSTVVGNTIDLAEDIIIEESPEPAEQSQ